MWYVFFRCLKSGTALVTPKTAPDTDLLARYAPLFAPMASKRRDCRPIPTTVISAIVACNVSNPIFFTGSCDMTLDVKDLAADIGGYLRWAFAKYRDVVKQERFRAVVQRKAICGRIGIFMLCSARLDATCYLY